MPIRTMKNALKGVTFYSSSFDTKTGTLVRQVEVPGPKDTLSYDGYPHFLAKQAGIKSRDDRYAFVEAWHETFGKKYGSRNRPFSLSPESVDVSITDWCNYGCVDCYQDSRTDRKHASKSLVTELLRGFEVAPYQLAIGGGEPTAHPDFSEILERVSDFGTVPNYTTAGHIFRPEVIAATNRYCGGVSITYHPHKGIERFAFQYMRLRMALQTQLNVHVIADRGVVASLQALRELVPTVGPLRIILLAYYPEVGRSKMASIMSKDVYGTELPAEIGRCLATQKMTFAFSEGLLPYFLSRPDIGVDTRFAEAAEGSYSCYVDPNGRMSHSSFAPPPRVEDELPAERERLVQLEGVSRKWKKEQLQRQRKWHPTVWDQKSQWLWNRGFGSSSRFYSRNDGITCGGCANASRCAQPNIHHFLACDYAPHNNPEKKPLSERAKWRAAMDAEEKEIYRKLDALGSESTPEERAAIWGDFHERKYRVDFDD